MPAGKHTQVAPTHSHTKVAKPVVVIVVFSEHSVTALERSLCELPSRPDTRVARSSRHLDCEAALTGLVVALRLAWPDAQALATRNKHEWRPRSRMRGGRLESDQHSRARQ